MKPTLRSGIEHELRYRVPESKLVPALYPEAPEFQQMPRVFATGFLVGLIEWACIQAIKPHLDGPDEQTVGTQINVSHSAATPPGLKITVKARLVRVDGRRLFFEVEAHDGVDLVSKGTHERFVIEHRRFAEKAALKASSSRSRSRA